MYICACYIWEYIYIYRYIDILKLNLLNLENVMFMYLFSGLTMWCEITNWCFFPGAENHAVHFLNICSSLSLFIFPRTRGIVPISYCRCVFC